MGPAAARGDGRLGLHRARSRANEETKDCLSEVTGPSDGALVLRKERYGDRNQKKHTEKRIDRAQNPVLERCVARLPGAGISRKALHHSEWKGT